MECMKKIHYGLAPVMQRGGDKGPGSVVSYYLLVGLRLRLHYGERVRLWEC
jgi:hypothetical protein